MNGYIAFYNGEKVEVEASGLYPAKLAALATFRGLGLRIPASKEHMVSMVLVEKDGQLVTRSTAEE